jgi:serine/threonine protein kinase
MPTDGWLLGAVGDAFRVVDQMHGRVNLIHADVKPGNFMREMGSQQLKIIDFDFATFVNEIRGVGDVMDNNSGVIRASDSPVWTGGTELYMPPEAFLYQEVSLMSDSWALGILLYTAAHNLRMSHPLEFNHQNLAGMTRKEFAQLFLSSDYSCKMWANDKAPLAADLVQKLLTRHPEHRLDVSAAVSFHPFFEIVPHFPEASP